VLPCTERIAGRQQLAGDVESRLDSPTNFTEDIIRAGQEAWQRLRSHATWQDWKQVGKAHVAGRGTAMREAHVNEPSGHRYKEAFGSWQKQCGFEALDKGDRARLFEVMDHLAEIEAWLATLAATERMRLNHPTTVLRKWKKSTAVPDPSVIKKPSPYAQLQDAHQQLIEDHHRLEREIDLGGGDLWSAQDAAKDIQAVMQTKLSADKAFKVGRELYLDGMKALSKPKRLDEVEKLIRQLGLTISDFNNEETATLKTSSNKQGGASS